MNRPIGCLVVSLCGLMGCTPPEQGAMFQLVEVRDGDTILVEDHAGNQQWVDLAWLDAPEPEQPYGREARQMLKDALTGKALSLVRYDETAEIFIEDGSVNLLMVEQGSAWVRRDIDAPLVLAAYTDAESMARQRFTGLWGQEHGLMVPPWQWRAQAKEPSRMRPPSVLRKPLNTPPKINKRPVNPDYAKQTNETETP